MAQDTIVETNLPLKLFKRGKVRDIYDLDGKLLMIATDRISAFDYVLPDPIPQKGVCLLQISKFWFDYFKNDIPNHVISADIGDFPDELKQYRDILQFRSMIVKKTKSLPVECVVRGYLSGSAWKKYKDGKDICGIRLPPGLKESEKLDEPIFTPTTKAESGHDVDITFEQLKEIVGKDVAEDLREKSIEIYNKAAEYSYRRDIIIADTKFEFGLYDGELIIIDELLTPDSSRFWPASQYEPGKSQPSFDKQYVRDYLETTGWDKNSDPPHLPEEIIRETRKKYIEAYEKITGKKFDF
jgi:phosphoribosylaminoimidazole-succinocarboxamide synthase